MPRCGLPVLIGLTPTKSTQLNIMGNHVSWKTHWGLFRNHAFMYYVGWIPTDGPYSGQWFSRNVWTSLPPFATVLTADWERATMKLYRTASYGFHLDPPQMPFLRGSERKEYPQIAGTNWRFFGPENQAHASINHPYCSQLAGGRRNCSYSLNNTTGNL